MPNLITFLRILIVPVLFSVLLYYEPQRDYLRVQAFWLFLFGSVTDAVDGLVARLGKQTTELGQFLDPLADKLLLLGGYLGIFMAKDFPLLPPVWILVTIVFRDLVITGGLVVFYMSGRKIKVQPNFLGKATTAIQMATLISILLLFPVSPLLWNLAALLTMISGLTYAAQAMKHARR